MILFDVNVLVYAFREDAPEHKRYRAYLENVLIRDAAFAASELVLSSFLRIVTNTRIFKTAAPLEGALQFVELLRTSPQYVTIAPGARHWDLFVDLCRKVGARGDIVPDAYFAALAIESGSEWVSADRGFGRFPGLTWKHPLD